LNAAGKYDDQAARDDVIRYITQKCKTPSGFIGACGVELPYAAQQMQEVSAAFKKDNKVRIRHFVVSFYYNEYMTPYKANMIASMIAEELGRVYQCVYAVHEDTDQVHVHFVFNPVSFINGYKYSGTKGEHKDLKQKIEKCVKAMGIHIFYEVKYYPEAKDCYE
jgi:hypothetical protein